MVARDRGTAVEQERVIASLPVELRDLARHVLLGGFNRRGRAVGFHHAPGGVCPPGRRIDQVLERDADGSYRARVSFWHPARGWVPKPDPHTMFPDEWTSEMVIRTGLGAYKQRTEEFRHRWRNPWTLPPIRGFQRRGHVPITFFPDAERSR